MDRLIKRFAATRDGDLMLCPARGVAWQRDMSVTVPYDEAYFEKCAAKEGGDMAEALNAARVAFVERHLGPSGQILARRRLLDVGVGTGAFIRARGRPTYGYDVNPKAVAWLKLSGLWADDLTAFDAFSFWDVLEHVPEPEQYLKRMPQGSWLFAAIPVFEDLAKIRESKHYRPGEHLYYWTRQGFADWLALYRFRLVETDDVESELGRESIARFAFVRDLPGYAETLAQYEALHAEAYGTSAWLHLEAVAGEVMALKPASILDYGCGRSDLVAHFWADGKRRIARYDPAIAAFKVMPEGRFDLVLCTDVLEHVRMEDVDRVLAEIRAKTAMALFTISLRPARRVLPDGRNAHVTLLSAAEWTNWIGNVFGQVTAIPTAWEHELMLKTW